MSLAFVPAGSVSAFPQHITYSEMHPVCDGFFASQSSLDFLGDCQGKIFLADWMMKKLHVAGVVVAGERLYPGGLSGQDC